MQTQDQVTILLQVKEQIEGLVKVQQRLESLEKQAGSFMQALKTGLGINLTSMAWKAWGLLQQLPGQLENVADSATNAQAAMERLQFQTAAVLMTADPSRFPDYSTALQGYMALLPTMRDTAKSAGTSVAELGEVWAALAPQLALGNVPLEKQLALIGQIVLATKTLGLNGPQLLQESRALITGEIKTSAFLGSSLGLKGEEGAKQIQKAKDEGRLYEFLTEKLQGFSKSAEAASESFDRLRSRLDAARNISLAEIGSAMSEQSKETIKKQIQLESELAPARKVAAEYGEFWKESKLGMKRTALQALQSLDETKQERQIAPPLAGGFFPSWILREQEQYRKERDAIAAGAREGVRDGLKDVPTIPGLPPAVPKIAVGPEPMPITDYSTSIWEDAVKAEAEARKVEQSLFDKLITSALGMARPELTGLSSQGIYVTKAGADQAANGNTTEKAMLGELRFIAECLRSGIRLDGAALERVF